MIHDLKPYPAYKNSGVPWLGQVPEHWGVQRGKCLFNYRKEINVNRSNSNILSLTLRGVVNNNPDDPEGLVPKDYGSYQIFKKGDLVFKLIDLENLRTSRVGLVHEDGIMSPAYVRLTPQTIGDIRFFYHQYFDLYQRGIYNQLGAGVRSTLGPIDLLNLNILVPPLTEQSAIVRYLDYMDRRIRRYIHAKQKLIKLLEEQKQAIIHRAVTRGLDPNVKLKPSGVEWLGDVPEHWEVVKLGFKFRCTSGSTPSRNSSDYFGGSIAWIRTGELVDCEIYEAQERITDKAIEECSMRLLPVDTLLIAMYGQGQTRGRTGLLKIEATINQACFAILPNTQATHPKYLQYWFISQYSQLRNISDSRNATQPNLNGQMIKDQRILLPPLIEQLYIIENIQNNTQQINITIKNTLKEITLLREYRTRLIADVVTGKLDVRVAAANLPDELEEPEVLEDEVGEGEGLDDEQATDLEEEDDI